MPDQMHEAGRFTFVGGRLCLDFANTADWHASDQPTEFLQTYEDLLAWSRFAHVLSELEATGLGASTINEPTKAVEVLVRAVTLREAIYRIFSARVRGQREAPEDLGVLNREVTTAFMHLHVASSVDGFTWSWALGDGALDRMLWPIARSAAELLTSPELDRVRECAGHPCGWLFLDMSRNRSRRWCNMQSCGNRAKARRHYERERLTPGRQSSDISDLPMADD